MRQQLDIRFSLSTNEQCSHDFPSGRITLSMNYASSGMRRFGGELQSAFSLVEFRAPLDQLSYIARPLVDQYAYCFAIAKSGPGVNCVVKMDIQIVFFAEGDRHAALRVFRVG